MVTEYWISILHHRYRNEQKASVEVLMAIYIITRCNNEIIYIKQKNEIT